MLHGAKILIIDDNESIRNLLARVLTPEGVEVFTCGALQQGRETLLAHPVDLVLLDLLLPDGDGMQLLAEIKQQHPDLPVVIITGHGSIERAVEAMKAGAFDFLKKPLEHLDLIRITADKALEQRRVLRENVDLRRELSDRYGLERMIGRSAAMQRVIKVVRQLEDSDATVLIRGESGTGKELLARAIHYRSGRSRENFVTVDCGSLPETLIESELFGHTRGAFTGAVREAKGLFREAHRGTIFLDEIGEVPLHLQAKLLRVLQEREVRPLGSSQSVPADVRVIAASNRDLRQEVREGRFREDLFYRLNVIAIELPPLRERAEDIPLLVAHFLEEHRQRTGNAFGFSPEAVQVLTRRPWPGNVRELQNLIEQTLALARSPEILPEHLPIEPPETGDDEPVPIDLDAYERLAIERALNACGQDVDEAARTLKIGLSTLYRKMKRHGIPHPRASRRQRPTYD